MKKELTEQQRAFVDALLTGVKPTAAAREAGYGGGKTPVARIASMLMRKASIKAALAAAAKASARGPDGEISERWLEDQLIAGTTRPLRQTQVDCLLELSRRRREAQAKPADAVPAADAKADLKSASDADLHAQIVRLETELKVRESVHPEMVVARTLTEVLNDQQSPRPLTQVLTDRPLPHPSPENALKPPQDAIPGHSTGEAKAKPAINNFLPTDPNERQDSCAKHGAFTSTLKGRPAAWSFCPSCVRESDLDFRKMQNRMPAGDYRGREHDRWK